MSQHLSIERLAALVDEQPTNDERAHLAQCAACAREVDAHRSLYAMAGSERDAMQLPLTRWDSLSERLRAEGLISRVGSGKSEVGSATQNAPRFAPPTAHSLLRIAAAIMLVAAGVLGGRASAGAALLPGGLSGDERATLTANTSSDTLPTSFASVEDARRWKNYYHAAYQNAVSFLATNDSGVTSVETPAVMRARLSALDEVTTTMRQALDAAPYDPVINEFYLSSFDQREATLRRLNTVVPQPARLNGF